jgi:hypothetical protein
LTMGVIWTRGMAVAYSFRVVVPAMISL